MMTIPEPHSKKFQIDRIIFFSDAVFAIAITLLIIEVKVPEMHEHPFTDGQLFYGLLKLIPQFIGVLVSFLVIGVYWMAHHMVFGYVIDYNPKLIWINLFFLLSIIFMPFSSALYSEYWMSPYITHQAFYLCNILFTGLLTFRLWSVIGNPKYKLSQGLQDPQFVRYYKTRALTPPVVFILSLLLALINPYAGYFVPALIMPLAFFIVRQYYKKKHPALFSKPART